MSASNPFATLAANETGRLERTRSKRVNSERCPPLSRRSTVRELRAALCSAGASSILRMGGSRYGIITGNR